MRRPTGSAVRSTIDASSSGAVARTIAVRASPSQTNRQQRTHADRPTDRPTCDAQSQDLASYEKTMIARAAGVVKVSCLLMPMPVHDRARQMSLGNTERIHSENQRVTGWLLWTVGCVVQAVDWLRGR